MRKTLLAIVAITGILGTASLLGAEQPPAAEGPEALARGLMLFHEGRMIFSPCRERSYVEVEDVSPDGQVTSALQKLGLAADKPLYAELFGEAGSGTLRAQAVNVAHVEARCAAALRGAGPWRAVGQGPTWSMTTAGDKLRLHVQGQNAIKSTYTESRGASAVTTLTLEAEAGQWQLRRELCFQPDNRLVAGWSITGTFRGKTLSGCAWKP